MLNWVFLLLVFIKELIFFILGSLKAVSLSKFMIQPISLFPQQDADSLQPYFQIVRLILLNPLILSPSTFQPIQNEYTFLYLTIISYRVQTKV